MEHFWKFCRRKFYVAIHLLLCRTKCQICIWMGFDVSSQVTHVCSYKHNVHFYYGYFAIIIPLRVSIVYETHPNTQFYILISALASDLP